MKTKNIVVGLIILALFGTAGFMAIKGVDGWGWFLFVGVLCFGAFEE